MNSDTEDDLLTHQQKVIDLADLMAAAVPAGTPPMLVISSLKHMLAASVIGLADSENRARGAMKLITEQLVGNTNAMLKNGWRK